METCLISAQTQAGEKICLLLNIPSPFNFCSFVLLTWLFFAKLILVLQVLEQISSSRASQLTTQFILSFLY